MRQTLAEVTELDTVGSFTRVRFAAPAFVSASDPGRAILARLTQTYLRCAWWPCAVDREGFALLWSGQHISDLRTGDHVDVLGPIGRGFRLEDSSRNILLVAAGSNRPDPDIGPLLPLVDRALATGRAVTLAYAAPSIDTAYPVSELLPAIEVIRAIDADLVDWLPEAIVWADQVFTCGPADFTARLAERIRAIRFPAPRGFAQALRRVDLPCGVGACGGCWNGSGLACVDGPVFALAP